MNSYGAEQRLEEQVSVLANQGTPTAIVSMSMLGEPAVPYLVRLLMAEEIDGDETTRKVLNEEQADAVVRGLGMIAHESAVPALAAHFQNLEADRYGRSSFRAAANALRKIGTPTALEELVARIHEFDDEHAAATVRSFGERGESKLVSLLEQAEGARLVAAVRVAARLGIRDAVPRLVSIVQEAPSADAAILAASSLAHFPNVPGDPLIRSLAKALAAQGEQKYPTDYRWDERPAWSDPNFTKALLSAIYHSQGPKIVPHLLPLAADEHDPHQETNRRRGTPISDIIVSYGKEALPFVEGRGVEAYDDATKSVAAHVAYRIRKGDAGDSPEKSSPGTNLPTPM